MMQSEKRPSHEDEDRQLWQQFRQATIRHGESAPTAIGDNDLAAYLDGTADPTLVENIEQQMAVDPTLLETVIELRQLRETTDNANDLRVPQTVLSAAKAVIPQMPRANPEETTTTVYRINWSRLQWAAAAVFMLTAGWGGYRTGLNAYTTDGLNDVDSSVMAFDLDSVLDAPSMPLIDMMAGDDS